MLSATEISFYLDVFKDLGMSDVLSLAKLARTRHLKAGEVLIAIGSQSQKVGYIKSGLIRAYHLRPNGDEVTMMLRWEKQFIASVDTVIFQQPSRYIYHALEDTVVMELDYLKAQPIIEKSPKLSASRNSFVMHMLGQAMDRIEGFVLLSPEERYLKLVTEKPDINNRVPDKYIATLLGITPVSLSRIRKRIAANGKR